MKTRMIGLILLIAVILGIVGYSLLTSANQTTTISGFVGGEKIGLLEDEAFSGLLRSKYHLTIDYAKAGSIDMVTENAENRDFLFPSSQTALEIYQQTWGKPKKSEIVLNTPIVLYTHKAIADALQAKGIVSKHESVYTVEMAALVALIEDGATWADIGLPQLYGTLTVATTDPTRSNSGNMFAGLLANTMVGGTADSGSIGAVLPRLKAFFTRLGYMESSSSDLFDQFLKTGMGAKPMIAGYENQLLEFAVAHPDIWQQVSDDLLILYPTPTVWSSHVYIALSDEGTAGIDALMDSEVQNLAWTRHGFRTGVQGAQVDVSAFGVSGLATTIDTVAPMPDAATMEKIIDALR